MGDLWKGVLAHLDEEADRFIVAVQDLQNIERTGRPIGAAWQRYLERTRELKVAVDEVVKFEPTTTANRKAKLGVAGRLTMLCHCLDEAWLEFEAERIAPDQRRLADVFLD